MKPAEEVAPGDTGERQARLSKVKDRRHVHPGRVAVAGVFLLTWSVTALVAQAAGGYLSDRPLTFWALVERNVVPMISAVAVSMLAYARLFWRQQDTDREVAKKADRDLVELALTHQREGLERVEGAVDNLRVDMLKAFADAAEALTVAARTMTQQRGRK